MERIVGFLLVFTIIILLYYFGDKALKQKKRPAFTSKVEYWIYGTQASLPHYDAFKREFAKDVAAGQVPEVALEDLARYFSDTRLSITIVLRAKNEHLFDQGTVPAIADQPGYFLGTSVPPTSFVRVAFIEYSDEERPSILRLVPFMTRTLARMTRTSLVYDVEAQRMRTVDEFDAMLQSADSDTLPWSSHIELIEEAGEDGETTFRMRGMRKFGLNDLACNFLSDTRTVVEGCIEKFLETLTNTSRNGLLPLHLEEFGNQFVVQVEETPEDEDCLRVYRSDTSQGYI